MLRRYKVFRAETREILCADFMRTQHASLVDRKTDHPAENLCDAAAAGQCSVVTRLLDAKSCVDGQVGTTAPLGHAAANGHVDVVALLISRGAQVNEGAVGKDSNHYVALAEAIAEGHLDVVKVLIASGSEINPVDRNGDAPLHLAVVSAGCMA